jgi:hypothetical protein
MITKKSKGSHMLKNKMWSALVAIAGIFVSYPALAEEAAGGGKGQGIGALGAAIAIRAG